MSAVGPLHAFAGVGVELEYMIVDRDTLAVQPIADRLLVDGGGHVVNELERGEMAWSNELTLHVIELKNRHPSPDLAGLAEGFQAEVGVVNQRLAPLGARLMPGGVHPWMIPATEARLWPHQQAGIYRAYDRIFGCRQHGFANVQSMHLNLPFADDAEFVRLHAAVRVLLPILPALAASSPILDGRRSGVLDRRMEAYRAHQARLPASIAAVVPDRAGSRAEYEAAVLAPMYHELAPYDPEELLRHEWFNARGAVPRFQRGAIEIRVIDIQECPRADLAIASLATAVARALYEEQWSGLQAQQVVSTAALVEIFRACIRDGDGALIADPAYLGLLDYPARSCRAGTLWGHLIDRCFRVIPLPWREALNIIREEGPLARRILRAIGPTCEQTRLTSVYRGLCDCLAEGSLYLGLQ